MQLKPGFIFLTSELNISVCSKDSIFSSALKLRLLLKNLIFNAQTDCLHAKYAFSNNNISNLLISELLK